ncbi:hypothetical protein SAMN05216249_11189 [Acetitomaculum ruminis DSM 5522]|uniref:Uncharacterized protein n=1 Tax=Acetitomaculum ruminis DSM 5522 TaxID=1120918 RepID=A0A1I0YWM0_9FIRM|nr:hypothetical protein [Acetitomaculum ruminis]SFB17226.1 hypothetical protein SAMN05216249_11189 [Acetitomaculum ruminis DSM 5522]
MKKTDEKLTLKLKENKKEEITLKKSGKEEKLLKAPDEVLAGAIKKLLYEDSSKNHEK